MKYNQEEMIKQSQTQIHSEDGSNLHKGSVHVYSTVKSR